MQCKICWSTTKKSITWKILWKYDISYFHCWLCNFLQTEEPYWLEESYSSSMNMEDTGLIARNIYFSKVVSILLVTFFDWSSKYLDYAWWYGIFTRLMRDFWFNFYRDDVYTKNLVARWFEHIPNHKYQAITAFEVFEHLVNPIQDIEKMLSYADTIFFSTELLPRRVPWIHDRRYYGLSHWQHIAFYNEQTFDYIAKKYHYNFYTYWINFHILTKKNINNSFLQWILLLSKILPFELIRLIKKSKTVSDMNFIIDQKHQWPK